MYDAGRWVCLVPVCKIGLLKIRAEGGKITRPDPGTVLTVKDPRAHRTLGR